jgi:hypothetical protein
MEVSGQLHVSDALLQKKECRYALNMRLEGGGSFLQLPMWNLSKGGSTFTLSGIGKDFSVVPVA